MVKDNFGKSRSKICFHWLAQLFHKPFWMKKFKVTTWKLRSLGRVSQNTKVFNLSKVPMVFVGCSGASSCNIPLYEQRCEIFSFFFLSLLKTREKYISFAQFVYFLREACLLFNFWMVKFTIMSKKYNWEFYHSKIEK